MNDEGITSKVKDAYAGLISGLLDLEMKDGWPVLLGLEKDALELFRRWHDSHMAELGAQSPLFDGFVSKLKGYCARLALLNALIMNPNATTVPIKSVEAAIEQINYFKAQAMKVCRSVGVGKAAKGCPVEECVKEIMVKVTLKGLTKKRALQRSSRYSAAIFNEAWKRIEEGKDHLNNLSLLSTDKPTPTLAAVA